MAADFTLSKQDLTATAVLAKLQQEQNQEDMAKASRTTIVTPIVRSPFFYYPFAGTVGGLLAYAAVFLIGGIEQAQTLPIVPYAMPYVFSAALIGLTIGMTYGLILRNLPKAMLGGVIGCTVALVCGLLTCGVAEGLRFAMVDVLQTTYLLRTEPILDPTSGVGLCLRMGALALGWMCVGAGVALGPGLLLRSSPLMNNGLIAGAFGGVLAGLVMALLAADTAIVPKLSGSVREALGLAAFGLLVGAVLAAMEFASREAWFVLARGRIKGKRLVFFRSPVTVGCASSCEIRLGGDKEVEPLHFTLTREGLRWLLTDDGSKSGTYVNGHQVNRCLLSNGDVVTIGETVLKFRERRKRG